MVIDFYAQKLCGVPFDRDGEMAARGVNLWGEDLDGLHPYFARAAPKSCGREEFGETFALRQLRGGAACDQIRSATELTARSVADSLRRFGGLGENFELIVSGGGARNLSLLALLGAQLPEAQVKTSDELGVPSAAREAMAFALLAAETCNGVATSVPGATGARAARVLGKRSG